MKKNGRPYSYPDTVIMTIAGIRAIHGSLPYRMCQGMAISALGEEDAPDHVTLWRRIKAMKIRQECSIIMVRSGNYVLCLIPDTAGAGAGHAERLDTPQAQEGARIHQAERHDKPRDTGDPSVPRDRRAQGRLVPVQCAGGRFAGGTRPGSRRHQGRGAGEKIGQGAGCRCRCGRETRLC